MRKLEISRCRALKLPTMPSLSMHRKHQVVRRRDDGVLGMLMAHLQARKWWWTGRSSAIPVGRNHCPLRDRGRRGGDAETERVAGRCSAHRGPRARRPTRTQKVPTRNGVSEPGPRPTARTPARRRSQWLTGELGRGHHPPQQGSPARSLVASSTTDGHRARGRTPVGSDTPVEFCQPAVAACHHRERRNPQ